MRMGLVFVALATLFGFATPASAAIITTTASDCIGSVPCPFGTRLAAFDSSLGVLENIILHAEVDSQTAYVHSFQSYADYPNTSGSAHLEYEGPFQLVVNGITFTIQISGEQDLAYTDGFIPFGGVFHATGSLTTNIDHSLLDSFVDVSNNCGFGGVLPGVCARGLTMPPGVDSIVQSSNNIHFTNFDVAAQTQYTLTYVFRPVPEPATWAMMLLGFGAIGLSIGKKNARKRPSCPEELPATR
jgi:hypothetical protein